MKLSAEGKLRLAAKFVFVTGVGTFAGVTYGQTNNQPTELQKIIVTGSAIPRTQAETASPVQIITRADIERSGLTTTAEVVQSISANNSGSVTPAVSNSFATGGAGVALRGLDVNSTLILIDGRRAANYGLADDGQRGFVDLNSIPINEIERVEVLKDGASSLYGADAIAGVVNIILKKEFRGLEASGELGTSQHGGGTQRRFMATLGGGSLTSNGHNAYIGIEYERDDKILASQRKFPFNTTNLSSIGGVDGRWGQPSSDLGSIYGTVTPATLGVAGDLTTGTPITGAVSQPLRPCGPPTQQMTDGSGNVYCAQNQAAYVDDQPEDERFGVFTRLTMKLNDSATAYVTGSYYQNKVRFDTLPAQINAPFPTNTNAIALPVNLSNGALNPNNPFASQNEYALVNYAFGDIPGSTEVFNQNYRLVGGVRGSFEDWEYDSAIVINHTSLTNTLNGFLNGAQLLSDIETGAYSFVDPGSNSAAVRSALAPSLSGVSTTDMNSIDFRASRSLINLPGGPLGVALGTEYRYEAANSPDLNPGLAAQGLGQSFVHGSHNVEAVYAEFDAPLLKTLEADLSARFDNYSDFGSSGLIPKFGLKWTPIDQFALRGTYSEGFRAPSFAENGSSAVGSFVGPTTPVAQGASPTFIAAHTINGQPDAYITVPYTIASATAGNSGIKPEKAQNFTLGTVFQPFKQFSGSLDYYYIRKRNDIEAAPLSPAIAAFYSGVAPPAGYTVTADKPDPQAPAAPPRLAAATAGFINAASVSTQGLDLDLRAKFNLYPGIRFLSDIEGTDTLTYKVAQVGGPAQEYVGTDSPFALNTSPGVSQYKAVWSNTLIVNKAEVSAIAHYQSGITLEGIDVAGYGVCLSGGPTGAPFPSNCHEHHFAYFDMTGMYHLTKDIDLTAAIENVLDTKPPLEPAVGAGTNYDPTFAMAGIVGRFFRAGVKYSFH